MGRRESRLRYKSSATLEGSARARPADQPAGAGLSQLRIGSPLVMKRAWSTVEVASADSAAGRPRRRRGHERCRHSAPAGHRRDLPRGGFEAPGACCRGQGLHPGIGLVELSLHVGPGGGHQAHSLHHAPGELLGRERPQSGHGEGAGSASSGLESGGGSLLRP